MFRDLNTASHITTFKNNAFERVLFIYVCEREQI